MQLAHGHWENICLQSENHTHLSSHFAKGCYSLSRPWALIQCKSPKWDPVYTILYAGSHILPILPFHLKITSPSVKWVTTTQIKTLCNGKLRQSPKVTERMARAVGSCWWLLLLMATRGIEGHVGDSAFLACSIPHCLSEDNTWAKLSPGSGLFLSLLHEYYAIYLLVFPSALSQMTSHFPLSVPLLAHGMEWITHFPMKTRIHKSSLKEDYSDHCDNRSTIDSQNKADRKTPNI